MASAAPPAAEAAVEAAARACFNQQCKEPRPDATAPRRQGWRLRSGELADLCDRCCSAYEQGTFCEMFHRDAAGWCSCESCGKRLHCGCIVSSHAYLLLDAGGVECVPCARKSLVMVPNQMSPSTSLPPLQASERPKELPAKGLTPMTTYPRPVHRIWSLASTQSDLNRRLAYELDRPNGSEKLISGVRSSIFGQEKKVEDLSDRITSSSQNPAMRNRYANGSTNLDSVSTLNTFHREGIADGMQGSGQLVGESDPVSIRKSRSLNPCSTSPSGINSDAYPSSCVNTSVASSIAKDYSCSPLIGLAAPFQLPRDANDPSNVSATLPHGQMTPPLAKQLYADPQNVTDSELQAQMRNGRHRMDSRSRNQLLPRYWPRITDQELQQISGDSNSVITPLFEKVLSASDAGRIGRLVLPKKCAEAYFPAISQPEGLPLKVQDAKGKEWVFQFRFWPNNNSRMYVLEGVTPCIQSMHLQAGDIVTFSRLDPEGKLIMGFRKAFSVSPEQDNQAVKAGSNGSMPPEVGNRNNISVMTNLPPRPFKGSTESRIPINAEDQASLSKIDKGEFIQKYGPNKKSSPAPTKKRGGILGPKSKRLRIENEDSIELKLTWQEAQELLRPPPNCLSSVVVIEGHEVEEYEEAPVLGMPTIFTTDESGDKHQWAQCENCSKWRKLPVDALLNFRWTCSDNKWDPERSSCTSPQELSKAQLADLLPGNTGASRRSKVKLESEAVELSDGLDTLANLAILGEGESLPSSSQPTTKHPRHRPGCTCIVCIQPPSGKGPKHKQTCACNVCLTVKRRFRTLMMRRELRQSEKEAETSRKQQHQPLIKSPPQMLLQGGIDHAVPTRNNVGVPTQEPMVNRNGMVDEESEWRTTSSSSSLSPLKNQIDLNIQPEREEEPSHARVAVNILNRDWLPKLEAEGETLE